jgi:hypothetical protein
MKPTGKGNKVFIIAVLFMCAAPARAAVIINEVMYNPQGSDSGREWVELYNDGASDVTLVGGSGSGSWRIADSSNHTLVAPPGNGGRGSLVVPAGGYLIIANDPATFINEYGGSYPVARSAISLNNTGATVSLINGTGSTVSAFTYTTATGGNDDGTSLQVHDGSILQALPTPGAANAIAAYVPPAGTDSSTATTSSDGAGKTQTKDPGYVNAPLPQVFARAGADRTVIVGADAKFVALAYDRDKSVIKYAKFTWTFGDGTVAAGPVAMHHFSYPGRYAVELVIDNDAFHTSDRITVVAESARIGLSTLPHGGVAVQNLSGKDLDLSFWKVVEGDGEFVLPEHTVALKDAAINISAATLGFEAADPELLYPDGTKVELAKAPEPEGVKIPEPVAPKVIEPKPAPVQKAAGVKVAPAPSSSDAHASTTFTPAQDQPTSTVSSAPIARGMLTSAATESGVTLPVWAYGGALGGLIGLGLAGVLHVQRLRGRKEEETPLSADEFEIV